MSLEPAVSLTARQTKRLFHLAFEPHKGLGAEFRRASIHFAKFFDFITGLQRRLTPVALFPNGRLSFRNDIGGSPASLAQDASDILADDAQN